MLLCPAVAGPTRSMAGDPSTIRHAEARRADRCAGWLAGSSWRRGDDIRDTGTRQHGRFLSGARQSRVHDGNTGRRYPAIPCGARNERLPPGRCRRNSGGSGRGRCRCWPERALMNCSCSLARRPEAGRGRRESAGNCAGQAAVDCGTPRYLKPDAGQPWLEVGAADDPLEHEAEAFSSAVTAGRALPRFLSREQRAPLRRLGDPCAEECPPGSAEERVAEAAESTASEACPLRRASLRADPPDDDDSTPRRGSGRAAGSGGSVGLRYRSMLLLSGCRARRSER